MNFTSQDECNVLGHVVCRATQVKPGTEEESQLLLACNNRSIKKGDSSAARAWVAHARAVDVSHDLTRTANQPLYLLSLLRTNTKRVFHRFDSMRVIHIIRWQRQVKIEWSIITYGNCLVLLTNKRSLGHFFRFLVELSSLLGQFDFDLI